MNRYCHILLLAFSTIPFAACGSRATTSFPDSYILDPIHEGKPLSKTDQVWMIGNAVPPAVAEALVRANVVDQAREAAA